jgi:two-component system cell cycle response regulator
MDRLAAARPAAWALVALTGAFALLAFAYLVHPSEALRTGLNVGVYNNVVLAAGALCVARGALGRREERAWAVVGAAVLAWGIGNTYWTFAVEGKPDPPFPSWADLGFLAVYPLLYVAIVLLLRSGAASIRSSLLLDGLIGGAAIAAVGTDALFGAVTRALGGSAAADATNLAYPLADLALIALVVWSLAVMGWRPGRSWALLGAGLLVFSISDCLYLYETAVGSYSYGTATDLGWVAGAVLLAWAAWQPRNRAGAGTVPSRVLLVPPVVSGLVALGVLVDGSFGSRSALALGLAVAALVGVIARMALAFAANMRMLERSQHEARTDPLTGLRNRRQLLVDLEAHEASGTRAVLALFDLNGFKLYNDTFGHAAGDALLARLGGKLEHAAAAAGGRAYRMGGDEFCTIVPDGGPLADAAAVEAACAALEETGEGFGIGTAFGTVLVPEDADTATDALRLADQRMYAQKQRSRGSAGDQSSGVLLSALAERDPRLAAHVDGVAVLARAVAGQLGLDEDEVEHARLAGALHDIGKIGIPDAILHKAGSLSADEQEFIRRHPLIGERILLAAPALLHVAGAVRSSHERFDGGGYPDGASGDEIPLVARIVHVCDAFDAIVSTRDYHSARSAQAALEELRRNAGTQFDPAVVTALEELVARGAAPGLRLVSAA